MQRANRKTSGSNIDLGEGALTFRNTIIMSDVFVLRPSPSTNAKLVVW